MKRHLPTGAGDREGRVKRRRPYNTLGRRILALLELGGPRKHGILRAIAGSEERLQGALKGLKAAGRIAVRRRQGGIHYAAVGK